jgi:tetratricopeptide (TPR) repeat protein
MGNLGRAIAVLLCTIASLLMSANVWAQELIQTKSGLTDEDVSRLRQLTLPQLTDQAECGLYTNAIHDRIDACNRWMTTPEFGAQSVDRRSVAFFGRGFAFDKLGQTDDAIRDYGASLALNPQHTAAWGNRGQLYAAQGKFADAIADFDRALMVESNNAHDLSERGKVYGAIGKFDLALEDLGKAIKIQPRNAEYYVVRGRIHLMRGSSDDAIADFRLAFNLPLNHLGWTRARNEAQAELKKLGVSPESPTSPQ